MASNYPPGHPTGSITTRLEAECPNCHETVHITDTYERDTNAHIIDDDVICENCGTELNEQLDKLNWEPSDNEPDWDAMYDAQVERQMMEEKEDPYEGY